MRRNGGDSPRAAAREESPRDVPMRVLIADDDEIHRRLLSTALAREGYETVEAMDGVDALEKLRTGGFGAVISDVLMPRMDGYRLGYEVRQSRDLENIRIIVYSRTYTSLADERMALRAGADRFVRNSPGTETILRALRDATRVRRPRKAVVPPAAELAACREYSEVLVGRLESANRKLEASRKRLARANEEIRRSEERVRLLLDSTAEGIYGLDLDGNFTFCNAAALAMLGYASARELLGRNADALTRHTRPNGESYPMDESGVFRAIREDRGSHAEEEILWRADGTSFPAESWSYPVRKGGRPVGAVVTFLDITQRKQAGEAIRNLAAIVESSEDAIIGKTLDGTITAWNRGAERLYGWPSSEAIGQPVGFHIPPDRRDEMRVILAKIRRGESIKRLETVRLRKDEDRIEVSLTVSSIHGAAGEVVGASSIARDITERRLSEKALRESEQRFSLAFQASPIPMSISEIETGRILDVNQQFLRVLGYSREELIGKTSLELGIRADRDDRDQLQGSVRKEGAIDDRVSRIQTRSGEIRDVVESAVPIDLGSQMCELWTFLDVTERRRAEKEMLKSQERFRILFDSNTIGIVIADLDGNTLEANDAYLHMLGYTREELVAGRIRWNELTPAEHLARDGEAVEQLRRTGTAAPWEKELFRKDGTRVPVLIGIAMLEASQASCIAYIVDLSALRRLEEQFRLAQKMEAVGQLAGGVAHDFNNLLTAILGYSELLASKLDPGSAEFGEVEEIRKAGERAASLTRQLLAFSRQQVLERRVLDPNHLIRDVEKMLRRLIGEDIELEAVLDPALWRVRADAGQLEQVILNLAINSRDAMPMGGKLTIETSNVELDGAYASRHVTVRPGRYVMIAVSDTGAGMDARTLSRVFEPFFTTKERGKGTGLGLATVYGTVKQSGGYIWVYSEPGKGTAFKIYLPPVEEDAVEESAPKADPSALHGSETVLLVEDEESVRSLSRTILEGYGYTVLEAGSGEQALEILRSRGRPVHLVLTDVVMPVMSGMELVSRLEAISPGIRSMYMSGYTDDAVVRHGFLEKGPVFLQKPFTPTTLARKVREALGN